MVQIEPASPVNDMQAAWRLSLVSDTFLEMLQVNRAVNEIIQKPFNAPNNRKFERFWAGKGVYALMSWQELHEHFLLGQMIDACKEGCGICYVADRSVAGAFRLQKTFRLRIFGACKMVDLKNNTVVYDNELTQYSTAQISARQCGITYGKIS
jgi:hypothetical protein